MKCIAAFDIGIASVGWAVIDKETEKVIESAYNIFPEATAAENQIRRDMRQAKRLKRREKNRLKDFKKIWRKYGLLIPTVSRTDALEEYKKSM